MISSVENTVDINSILDQLGSPQAPITSGKIPVEGIDFVAPLNSMAYHDSPSGGAGGAGGVAGDTKNVCNYAKTTAPNAIDWRKVYNATTGKQVILPAAYQGGCGS